MPFFKRRKQFFERILKTSEIFSKKCKSLSKKLDNSFEKCYNVCENIKEGSVKCFPKNYIR